MPERFFPTIPAPDGAEWYERNFRFEEEGQPVQGFLLRWVDLVKASAFRSEATILASLMGQGDRVPQQTIMRQSKNKTADQVAEKILAMMATPGRTSFGVAAPKYLAPRLGAESHKDLVVYNSEDEMAAAWEAFYHSRRGGKK